MKNWIVKAKPLSVKGAAAHSQYLLDYNHKSHAGTSNIQHISGDFEQIEEDHNNLMMRRAKDNKGGRPPKHLGRSLVLSLPAHIRPSPEIWKKVVDNTLKEMAKVSGENIEDIAHFAVLHQEPHKYDHLHLLTGQNPNGIYNKKLTNKTMITAAKIAFNRTIKDELGLQAKEHKPKKETGKKDVPLWLARKNKKKEEEKIIKELHIEKLEMVGEVEDKKEEKNILKSYVLELKKEVIEEKTKLEYFKSEFRKFAKAGFNYIDSFFSKNKEKTKKFAEDAAKHANNTIDDLPESKKIINNKIDDIDLRIGNSDVKDEFKKDRKNRMSRCESCGGLADSGDMCITCTSSKMDKEGSRNTEKEDKKKKSKCKI